MDAHKFREMTFQMLCSFEYTQEKEELVALLMGELKVTRKSAREAHDRVEAISSRLQEIDEVIRRSAKEYQFERISSVEKNIIRLGVFELGEGLPVGVVFSEANRLCKKFGTPSSARFVHAILLQASPQQGESVSQEEDRPPCDAEPTC